MDAACVRIRPLLDGETAPVLAVFAGLHARSRELRFLAPKLRLTPTDLCHLTHVDSHDRVALVAKLADGRPVGIARFVRYPEDDTVADGQWRLSTDGSAVASAHSWPKRSPNMPAASACAASRRTCSARTRGRCV
jgi:hypothetical protein